MIFPLIVPGPTRYVDRWHDSGTSAAIGRLKDSQEANHREMLSAIKDIGQNKLAVTVIASEILPLATAAFNYLDGPCRDYDKAYSKWSSRYYKAKSYLRERKKRPKENANKAEIEAYRAKNLKKAREEDAYEHVRRNSSWFRGLPFHEAFKLVEEGKVPTPHVDKVMAWKPKREFSPYDVMYGLEYEIMEMRRAPYGSSAPKKPEGHGDLGAIREVYEAATATPNAMLTIPADTVRAIGKFAGIAGNVVKPCCENCGATNWKRIDGIRICSYCRSEG